MNTKQAVTVGLVIGGAFVILYLFDKVRFGFSLGGEILDKAASTYGEQQAREAALPRELYNTARSDYMRATGTNLSNVTWPNLVDWLDGDGPEGYTYGSARYPRVEDKGLLDALISVF